MRLACYTSGFTLIEWLISFCITLLLVTLVFQFSARLYSHIGVQSKSHSLVLEGYLALDHLARHIAQAPNEKSKWIQLSDKEVVWRVNNFDRHLKPLQTAITHMGYCWERGKLYFVTHKAKRKEGKVFSFGFSKRRQTKSLLASQIQIVTLKPIFSSGGTEHEKYIEAIWCQIAVQAEKNTKACMLCRTCFIKNRLLTQ